MQAKEAQVKFIPGDIVVHKKLGYRGVIIEVDENFEGTEEWYEEMAESRPPKNKPWYQVLVDGADHTTYVAERHLERDPTGNPVDHPLVQSVFCGYSEGRYQRVLH